MVLSKIGFIFMKTSVVSSLQLQEKVFILEFTNASTVLFLL